MKFFILKIVALTLMVISTVASRKHKDDWEEFKAKHGKTYKSDGHHEKRFTIYKFAKQFLYFGLFLP
jgi:hypothetical protein